MIKFIVEPEMTTHNLFVSYSQISVFDGRLKNPFNDWTDRHVHQGFSWRRGSVSFCTLIESGPIEIEISQLKSFVSSEDCVRAISVPFTCESGAQMEIATITDSIPLELALGKYQLVYETGFYDDECWCRFVFVQEGSSQPQILKKDALLDPEYPLSMDAEPA